MGFRAVVIAHSLLILYKSDTTTKFAPPLKTPIFDASTAMTKSRRKSLKGRLGGSSNLPKSNSFVTARKLSENNQSSQGALRK